MLMGAGAAALPLPAIAQNAKTRVSRFVPLANLTALDPIPTTRELILRHGGDFDRFAPDRDIRLFRRIARLRSFPGASTGG